MALYHYPNPYNHQTLSIANPPQGRPSPTIIWVSCRSGPTCPCLLMETKGEVKMASAMYSLERAVLSSLHAAR